MCTFKNMASQIAFWLTIGKGLRPVKLMSFERILLLSYPTANHIPNGFICSQYKPFDVRELSIIHNPGPKRIKSSADIGTSLIVFL